LISLSKKFGIVMTQIQNRCVMNYTGKEYTTISLANWKIILFDNEDVKFLKSIKPLCICQI